MNRYHANPSNMRRWSNVGLLLAHRLRRLPNSKPTLDQRLMFAGIMALFFQPRGSLYVHKGGLNPIYFI